jgi:hypothetical protein
MKDDRNPLGVLDEGRIPGVNFGVNVRTVIYIWGFGTRSSGGSSFV